MRWLFLFAPNRPNAGLVSCITHSCHACLGSDMVSEAPWLMILFLWLPEAASALHYVQIHFTSREKLAGIPLLGGKERTWQQKTVAMCILQHFSHYSPSVSLQISSPHFTNQMLAGNSLHDFDGSFLRPTKWFLWQSRSSSAAKATRVSVASYGSYATKANSSPKNNKSQDMEVKRRKKVLTKCQPAKKNTWVKSHVNKSVFSSSNFGKKKTTKTA